jgi:hypothetical protein
MATDVKITDSRSEWDQLVKNVKEIQKRKAPSVKVGIFGKQGSDLVKYAAANEFGAKINHPGGTPYGYETKHKAERGQLRFLEKGKGFMVVGETKAHQITIPERSYLRSTVIEKKKLINEFVAKQFIEFIGAKQSLNQSLNRIGLLVVSMVQQKIRKGPFKPNAPSTIRKKKSSRPLIDTGRMRQSISHEID